MSRDIQLKKGGRLFVKEWDSEENDFVEQEIDDEEFTFHLYDSICLDNNITLRDIFYMIKRNLGACSIAVGCPFLEDLVDEALSTPKRSEERKGLVALNLSWSVFIEEDDEGQFIIDHISFSGIGDKEYTLEFTPINELVLYPLMLNEDYIVHDGSIDEKIHLSSRKRFMLIDILRGIVDELSYMGPPDIREFALSELKKNSETDEDGIPRIFTHEDLEKRMKKKMEEGKKPCRICGKDARSPDFGKPADVCPDCYKFIKEN